ncbi:vanadium-dependent haloperoxidase [Archangium violaceum]|uniref:vanadium-dependent haloperoxidase n=1 Tax=Archangium violaceum TaxID=83451 RepID=UPI002B289DD0|nr:vanadium-dependent haloperoxidase [Archangium gephyra]
MRQITQGRRVSPRSTSGRTVTEGKRLSDKAPSSEVRFSSLRRRVESFRHRVQAARAELLRPVARQATNEDEERFPNRIGNFSKTLPHDDQGLVDPHAYNALLRALKRKSFEALESVPAGGPLPLVNPLGGLAFALEGADSPTLPLPPPASVDSAQRAAQLAELYWMALLREVSFSEYDSNPLALEARQDLARFSGYEGPRDPSTGEIRARDLFRVGFPGVQDGPLVSQFLLQPYVYDGIPTVQKVSISAPGQDFFTFFPEWLAWQRGQPFAPGPVARDPNLHFLRNARDLGWTAAQDVVITPHIKAILVLMKAFGPTLGQAQDEGNPYRTSKRQVGFSTFGAGHLLELLGKVHQALRHAWYQKWFVHRTLRPEEGGGLVHNIKTGVASHPLHADLLTRSSVLDRIFELNRQRNQQRPEVGQDVGTYLLPQLFREGAPTHPAYPAGHAMQVGACSTLLKAWIREDLPFPEPKKPTPDGLALEDYRPGVDGPELTLGGELNKLASNIALGRDMSGVHWRSDSVVGLFLGEEAAIRVLREEKVLFPERFEGFRLTRFDGTAITL